MPALPPYIPARQIDFDAWLANFSTLISANPGLYGIAPADAVTIAADVAAWAAAYAPVTSPSTKTASAVAAKDAARAIVTAQVRTFAQQIANNPGVLSSDKIALGLNPRTSVPTPITPPASNPVLSLVSCSNLSAYIRYRDSMSSPTSKGKPYGVQQCQLFGMTSATPITDPSVLPLKSLVSKCPVVLTFDSSEVGKQFYVAARWGVRSGGVSPWSAIISFTVVGAS
jgi:hypothetical protein